MSTFKWNDELTAKLVGLVGQESPVTGATVTSAAETLGTTVRSVAAKLRKLGHDVVSMAKTRTSAFSKEEGDQLRTFLEDNSGTYTYAEIAASFLGGKFSAKEIQGKILSLDLTPAVKKTEKVVTPRTYTPEEETKFLEMVNSGAVVEDIAQAFSKSIESVRGKALSMLRNGSITALPKQRESHAVSKVDPLDAIADRVEAMTVAEIAAALEKTERGVKTMLTRRGVNCADHKGAEKKAKAATPAVQ